MALLTFGRPSPDRLAAARRDRAAAALTYDHVASTLQPGAGRYERSLPLGSADGTFERAIAGLRAWACHAGIGATIHPPDAPLVEGTEVVVALPIGPLWILAPTRIVAVVDEPDRFGFAYGTLPGHPASGEEGFFVERQASGDVVATIRVESRGGWLLARVAAPVMTAFQRSALRRYLRGLQQFVERGGSR